MSEKHPECPLYNPLNCKEYYNPKLCAFVREDKTCLKKKSPNPNPRSNPRFILHEKEGAGDASADYAWPTLPESRLTSTPVSSVAVSHRRSTGNSKTMR